MRILVVTNLYPTESRPTRGVFVKEQVESMREQCRDLTIDVRIIQGRSARWHYLREIALLPAFVKKGGYDIVHAHFGLTLVPTLLVRAPLVVTLHGSDLLISPSRHISKLLSRRAAKVIVVAQSLRERLGYGEVIPCGIRVKDFALPPRGSEWKPARNPGVLRVLFPSNPSWRVKNYPLFKAVCRELGGKGRRIEEVHLMNLDRESVPRVYWACDVMILTSLSEGSPTVVKEAIAAKLPFVSVDVGDVREWAGLVEFGVVVANRDPKQIAEAAETLLKNIGDRSGLNNDRALDAMDAARIALRVRRVYDEVLSSRVGR